MAGHSQFKNIMHRKGAQDAKRAKVFTKIIRELTVSAKEGGGDPHSNPRLRAAISAAREANMSRDTMEKAIARGAGSDNTENYESIRYEGYGPGGVAFIVEALTDNRNRTAPELRSAFSKAGGSLGETNSVSFQFKHLGMIEYLKTVVSSDRLMELALEAGSEDIESSEDRHQVYCLAQDFHKVQEFLSQALGDPVRSELVWQPVVSVEVKGEEAVRSVMGLVEALEDNDDVQRVFCNADMGSEEA